MPKSSASAHIFDSCRRNLCTGTEYHVQDHLRAFRSPPLMSVTAIPSAPNPTPHRPPGPRGLPWLGTSFMASRDSTKTLTRWAREYGDIVYYHFLDFHFYLLFLPQHIEQVLLGKTGNFIKGLTSRANPELFGNGLLTSDGDFWRRQRRLSKDRKSVV